MTQKLSPFIEGKYGWDYGESGWNFGMDENLLKFSFLLAGYINGIVASLPKAVNGEAYFLTTDNRLYYAASGNWFSSPTPVWKTVKIKSTGDAYTFNGTTMVPQGVAASLDSPAFTGTPTAPDNAIGTSNSNIANTKFVTQSLLSKPSLKFVEDFGAVGNGTTDDTVAIQAAITYSSTNKLPVVFTKTYKAAKHFEIFQDTTLIGFQGAKIYIPSNVDFTGAPSYGGSVRAVHNAANIENVWIEGIDFYSDGNTGVYGATPPTNPGATKQSLLHADGGQPSYSLDGSNVVPVNKAYNEYNDGTVNFLPQPSQLDLNGRKPVVAGKLPYLDNLPK